MDAGNWSPSELLEHLHHRVATRRFSCDEFPLVERHSCWALQTAYGSLPIDRERSFENGLFGFFYAIEVLNSVETVISESRYRFLSARGVDAPRDAVEALRLGYGDVESRQTVFLALLRRLGFEATPAAWECSDGQVRVGAEVKLGIVRSLESPRFFDLSTGSFYLPNTAEMTVPMSEADLISLMSLRDLRLGKAYQRVGNDAELSRYLGRTASRRACLSSGHSDREDSLGLRR